MPLHAPKISPEDKEFLRKNNLSIELNGSVSFIKPSILLGCDQLWTLMKNDEPHIQLPSGLYLLPTTIGHLCTGKIKKVNQMHQKKEENTLLKLQQKEEDEIEQQRREDDDDIDNWEDHWTLQGQVNTALIHHSEPDDNEEIDWEKFWTLESAGTEEFTASEKEEKMRRDQKIWDNFYETIGKRTDGYYARLPWKEVSNPTSQPITKRTVASTLASVYDPMGFLLPLLHQAKVFLRSLWKTNMTGTLFCQNLVENNGRIYARR
ncbi:hypothetical protein KIN20_016025 [Parelaphostrongylus tenuis]|uniref:Uncharacterized protein n=1 Tax=Parelaphostrongylus tenuis TaxID=148309 RepID=A0AAD5QMP0_PARTN|nr:hypothetical protein KIN20_016025 [Parelaphostrongylus tenuis]